MEWGRSAKIYTNRHIMNNIKFNNKQLYCELEHFM